MVAGSVIAAAPLGGHGRHRSEHLTVRGPARVRGPPAEAGGDV